MGLAQQGGFGEQIPCFLCWIRLGRKQLDLHGVSFCAWKICPLFCPLKKKKKRKNRQLLLKFSVM